MQPQFKLTLTELSLLQLNPSLLLLASIYPFLASFVLHLKAYSLYNNFILIFINSLQLSVEIVQRFSLSTFQLNLKLSL